MSVHFTTDEITFSILKYNIKKEELTLSAHCQQEVSLNSRI